MNREHKFVATICGYIIETKLQELFYSNDFFAVAAIFALKLNLVFNRSHPKT